jgi:hypothetical protein
MSRGGKREGAGRKTLSDKKRQVSCYFLQSDIDILGKNNVQKIAQDAVHKASLLEIIKI